MKQEQLYRELKKVRERYVKVRVLYSKAKDKEMKEMLKREIESLVKRAKEIRAKLGEEVRDGL